MRTKDRVMTALNEYGFLIGKPQKLDPDSSEPMWMVEIEFGMGIGQYGMCLGVYGDTRLEVVELTKEVVKRLNHSAGHS
jgi:hypothetical protein